MVVNLIMQHQKNIKEQKKAENSFFSDKCQALFSLHFYRNSVLTMFSLLELAYTLVLEG